MSDPKPKVNKNIGCRKKDEQLVPKAPVAPRKKRIIFNQKIMCPDDMMDSIIENKDDPNIAFSDEPKWQYLDSADLYKKIEVSKKNNFLWSLAVCAMKVSDGEGNTVEDEFKETPFWLKDSPPPHASVQLLNLIDYSMVNYEKTNANYKYDDKNSPTLTPKYPYFILQYGTFNRKARTKISAINQTDLDDAKFIARVVYNHGETDVYRVTNIHDRSEYHDILLEPYEYLYISRDDIEDMEITTTPKPSFTFNGQTYLKRRDFCRKTIVFDLYEPNSAEVVLKEIRAKHQKKLVDAEMWKQKLVQVCKEIDEKKATQELPANVPVLDELIRKVDEGPVNVEEITLKLQEELARLTDPDSNKSAKVYDSDEEE